MTDKNRRHLSVSADTYAVIAEAARSRCVSMSSIVTGTIEKYTPPVEPPRLPVSLACTGCKRPTLHRLAFAAPTVERWRCGVCGRSKLTGPVAS